VTPPDRLIRRASEGPRARHRRRRRRRRRRLTLVVAVLASLGLVAGACGSDDVGGSTAATSAGSGASIARVTGSITVSAAASLTGAFGTIEEGFEAANPGADVTVNLGSSGTLATQIKEGAPVDLAAFADEATMTELADAGLVEGDVEIFATNSLIIVTKPGNPKDLETLADLATIGTISLCVDTAPCGRVADQVLRSAGVTVPESSVTRGQDVKATLAAVTDGDAEAAIVYVTDAQAAGSSVATVEIATAQNAVTRYPIAVIEGTSSAALAEAFMAYVLGPDGQAVLEEAGFGAP
jgi:molybdate transport system substrate-binding protein